MIMAIFALTLQLLVGYTGLVSLGHAALLRPWAPVSRPCCCPAEGGAGNGWLLLLGAPWVRRRRYALVVGALVLRTRGVYFIMVTLAFAQMAYLRVPRYESRRRQRWHLSLLPARVQPAARAAADRSTIR